MKNVIQSSKKCAALLLATSLSACASYTPKFVPTAVHFNTVVEDTNNELLVLNIIRASERRPMYFTRISALRSNFTVGAGAGLNTAFPQQDITTETSVLGQAASSVTETISRGVNSISPTFSTSFSHTPGFDYQILDSQDFYRGILTPITVETVAHYMQQGWSKNLISMLTIESIEIRDKDKKTIKKYDNDPDTPGKIEDFKNFLTCVNLGPAERDANETVFSGLDKSTISSLKDLDLFNSARWSIGSDKREDGGAGKVVLSRPRSDTLKIGEISDGIKCNAIKGVVKDTTFTEPNTNFVQIAQISEKNSPSPNSVIAVSKNHDVLITMRSLNGVIYYLGECLRAGENACTYSSSSGDLRYITKIAEKSGPSDSQNTAFETSLYGKTYIVPKGDAAGIDRTFTSLGLVNQMLNLQKTASAAPSTSTVRVVN